MNKIVRIRYPLADLPDDLQEMMPGVRNVQLVMEAADVEETDAEPSVLTPPDRVLSLEELFALRRPPFRTTEEIVADIRQQRDEWDD